jgi:DNA-binding MarR family transcriptional regulator
MDAAASFCELFPQIYVRFCRRVGRDPRDRLTAQQDAVLHHLAGTGPLTIGEMAKHFGRAQSVVSELVAGMEKKGLLERMRDARDRRRSLVWLTDDAREVLARRQQVLDPTRVARAMRALPLAQRDALVDALRALVHASDTIPTKDPKTRTKET